MRKMTSLYKQAVLFVGYFVLFLSATIGLYIVEYQYHTQYSLLGFVGRFMPLLCVLFFVAMSCMDCLMAFVCEYMIRKRSGGRSVEWYLRPKTGNGHGVGTNSEVAR